MPPSDPKSAPATRKWRMLLPLGLILVLAAAWSAGWFYTAKRAEALIDAALAREAKRGRDLACAQKAVSGFPFRIVFDCSAPVLRIMRGAEMSAQATHLKAAVQIYQPSHIIVELGGPLTLTQGGSARGSAAWRLAQASIILASDDVEQIDIAIDDLALADAATRPLARAQRAEAHARKVADSATRDFDLALFADMAAFDPALTLNGGQIPAMKRAELAGTIRAVPASLTEDGRESLRAWQQNGGTLTVARLWADTGESAFLASGTLALEDSGRPTGAAKAALANPQALLANPQSGPLPLIMGAMQLIGKQVEIDGRRAVEIDISLQDGQMRIGPATLGRLPPLY